MQPKNFAEWRASAREYLLKGVPPSHAQWQPSLFMEEMPPARPLEKPTVPRDFLDIAEAVACAKDDDKWDLLYRLVYRINHENPHLMKVVVDPDVHRALLIAKSVRRDIHKMHAFVRFKKTTINDQEAYVAWHQPEHPMLELAAPFFERRFGDKPWSIFTPDQSAHWNMKTLTYGPGMSQHEFEHDDPFDEIWKTYYRSIFNPARLKLKAMRAEMSPKYWHTMPEAEIIRELIRDTPQRLQNMAENLGYLATVPETSSLNELKQAALKCQVCPHASHATQTVFGEGASPASLMIVGEQPGNEEDIQGHAFIGPAGEVLQEALRLAQIPRDEVYLTNAVKHFKWQERGKMRLHKKPSGSDMHACKPWLEAEIKIVQPKVIVALGVTAGTALAGRLVQIKEERQKFLPSHAYQADLLITWHPSAILRATNEEEKTARFAELVEDLRRASDRVHLK